MEETIPSKGSEDLSEEEEEGDQRSKSVEYGLDEDSQDSCFSSASKTEDYLRSIEAEHDHEPNNVPSKTTAPPRKHQYNTRLSASYDQILEKGPSKKPIVQPRKSQVKISLTKTSPDSKVKPLSNTKSQRTKIIAGISGLFGIIFVVVVAIALPQYFYSPTSAKTAYGDKFLKIKNQIEKLQNNFRNQDMDTWISLQEGIGDSYPVVFTLLYEQNQEEVECLVRSLQRIILHYLDPQDEPVIIRGSEVHINENLKFIEKYKQQVEKSHLMIIYDLNDLPGNVAESFHSYCDKHNPLVSNAIVIFTIKINNTAGTGRPASKASRFLENKWNYMERYKLDPLITRLTHTVLEIKGENNSFICPHQ